MSFRIRSAGIAALFVATVFSYTGCGKRSFSVNETNEALPMTNRMVAETVLKHAFDSISIPEENGADIFLVVEGNGFADDQAEVLATEFLFSKGFKVSGRNNSIPEIRFTVDTLYVALTREISGRKRQISRTAGARIEAVYSDTDATKKVYSGRGAYHDFFPASLLDAVGDNEPYVIMSDRFVSYVKPILFTITITTFLWYLYSFRG